MSTILDALKKSEQERKLNKLPTLTDMAAPQEPSRWPMYIGLALVVLAIALVVLAYVIWTSKPDVAQADAVVVTQADAEAVTPASSSDDSSKDAASSKDPMLVNVVSYSSDSSLRFAMVAGKMVREGDFIEPGLKVQEIQPDAVVFNARGEIITRSP